MGAGLLRIHPTDPARTEGRVQWVRAAMGTDRVLPYGTYGSGPTVRNVRIGSYRTER